MKTSNMAIGLAFSCLLTGCGGSSSDNGTGLVEDVDRDADTPIEGVSEANINATDYAAYRYFNLESGEELELTEVEASASTDWHIAFRRSAIKLNGGTSGPGAVAAALVAEQTDFYDAEDEPDSTVFLNATAESELEHLTASYDAPDELVVDELVTSLQGSGDVTGTQMDMGWYWYDFTSHQISLNDSNGWLLRSGEGNSYARFRATELNYDRVTGLAVTFDFDVQVGDTDQFSSTAQFMAQVDSAGGESCFDFDANATVPCSGSQWDLKLGIEGRDWYLHSNGGISGEGEGAAFGPIAWVEDLETYTSATIAPSGDSIAFHYSEDSSSGVFEADSWYAYNLTGAHKLYPNYRVYWIDADTESETSAKFLLQVTGYYSEAGEGGNPSIRWKSVE